MAVARERPEAPELRASTGGCVKGGVSISSLNFGIPRFSLSGWISLFFLSFFLQSVYLGVRIASRGGLPHSESFTGEAREIPECAYACRFERGKMSRMKINREIFDWNEPVLNTVPRIVKERKEKRRIGLNKQSG